jgi:membrane protease YdiL (CAAX protease family)
LFAPLLIVSIWALWVWFSLRKQPNEYRFFAWGFGLVATIWVGVSTFIIGMVSGVGIRLFWDFGTFLGTSAFVATGAYNANRLGLNPFAFYQPKAINLPPQSIQTPETQDELIEQSEVEITPVSSRMELRFPVYENPPEKLKSQVSRFAFQGILVGVLSGLGIIVFSKILFALTSPQVSAIALNYGMTMTPHFTVQGMLIVLNAAFFEEITYRLGIANLLAGQFKLKGHWYWVAAIVSNAIWTSMHTNIIDPNWIKYLQIFPSGIILTILFRRFGIESSIAAHMIWNGIGMFLF